MDMRKGAIESVLHGLPYFILGAAAGAAAGLLLAPEAGCQTRTRLAGWLKERREKGREGLRTGRERVDAMLAAGKEAYASGKGTYHRTLAEP